MIEGKFPSLLVATTFGRLVLSKNPFMCGFVGLVGAQASLEPIAPMLESIQSRGPDDTGIVRAKWFNLGICRLSIVALDEGRQPVSNHSDNIHLAFNGEIYNFRSIQSRLQRDYSLHVNSEAAALLRSYEKHGPSFVEELDGDFAIIILDSRSRTCYVFRDSLGVKPLYYTSIDDGRIWAFSSHLKAFFQHPAFTTGLDYTALAERQVLHFWSCDRTCFECIRQLPPGHLLKLSFSDKMERIQPEPVIMKFSPHQPAFCCGEVQSTYAENIDARCARLIRRAVGKRIEHSEVTPIVLALSGGIDSSLIAALATKYWPQRVVAVTIDDDSGCEDPEYATNLSNEIGLTHNVYQIALTEFLAEFPRMVLEFAGPHPSYAPYFLGIAMRECYPTAKVLLCGEGADEFFLGYSFFLKHDHFFKNSQRALRSLSFERIEESPLLQRAQQWGNMKEEVLMLDLINMFQHDQLVNSHLIPFDHGPMAHALECRVPFLDIEVVQYVQTIPENLRIWNQSTKTILRLLLADALAGTPELARQLLTRRPTPAFFSTMGCQNWLNRFLEEKFRNRQLVHSGISQYAKNLPDLFWLGSIATIFLKYRGRIDGMRFEELADEVLSDVSQ